MMTSRERLIAAMTGRPADRIAVAPFVYSSTVRSWKTDIDADVIEGTIEFCNHYGFDNILRNFNIRHNDLAVSTEYWQIRQHDEKEGNVTTTTTRIKTPEGDLQQQVAVTQVTPFLSVSAHREYFIKEIKDFRLFQRYQPAPAAPDLTPLKTAKELIAESGILAPWCWGIFNYLSELRSLDNLLTDPYLEPEFYEELADYALDRLKAALKPVLEEGLDMVSYTGNVAGGSLVGPAYFIQFVLPYEQQLIDYIQKHCLGVIYHNCGDGSNMIGCYNRLMPACYESMTEPPYADNSLVKCAGEFSKDITLMGNIDQINFLKTADAAVVTAKAKEVLNIMRKHPRFILGTSDFLEENTPEENLFALAQSVL